MEIWMEMMERVRPEVNKGIPWEWNDQLWRIFERKIFKR